MKKGRWRDAKALCPFYKYDGYDQRYPNAKCIFCEGVVPNTTIRQSFHPEAKKLYEKLYCKSEYHKCWICESHLKILEAIENERN